MAQKPLSDAKMFTASWTEKDEALLIDLLNRKINEIKFDIRDAESPYIKARLRAKRKEYKHLLARVMTGDYNRNILAAELASAKIGLAAKTRNKERSLGKYADSYADVDFDFKSYFGKTRYYGAGLPFTMLLMLVLLAVFMLASFILPSNLIVKAEDAMSLDARLTLTSVAYIKLGEGENDFRVKNDGNWPKGTFLSESNELPQGMRYKDPEGNEPAYVYLYSDLQMTSIDITAVDMFKALFRMKMFSKNRIDFIENLDQMQGVSWYYIRYMNADNRLNSMELPMNDRGNLDVTSLFKAENLPALVRYVCTNGAVVCLWITVLLCFFELVMCIIRMFTYTSRRLHATPVFILLFGLLAMLMPAFAEVADIQGATLGNAFTNYFSFYWSDFLISDAMANQMIVINILYLIVLAAIPVLLILLPLIMHNRAMKPVTFVPKGNKPHIYAPDELPVKPGQTKRYGLTEINPRSAK